MAELLTLRVCKNEIYKYFQDIAVTGQLPGPMKRRELFESLCKQAKYQSMTAPFYNFLESKKIERLIDAIMNFGSDKKQFLDSLESSEYVAARGNWFILYRALRKLEHAIVEKYKDDGYEKMDGQYFQAFKNSPIILKKESKIGVHAEAQMVAELFHQQAQNTDHPSEQKKSYYIGIGKLCCLNCAELLNIANQKSDGFFLQFRGRHDIHFGKKWITPHYSRNTVFEQVISDVKEQVKNILTNQGSTKHKADMAHNLSPSAHSPSLDSSGHVSTQESRSVVALLKEPVFSVYKKLEAAELDPNNTFVLVQLLRIPAFSDLFESPGVVDVENVNKISDTILESSKDMGLELSKENLDAILKNPVLVGAEIAGLFESRPLNSTTDDSAETFLSSHKTASADNFIDTDSQSSVDTFAVKEPEEKRIKTAKLK